MNIWEISKKKNVPNLESEGRSVNNFNGDFWRILSSTGRFSCQNSIIPVQGTCFSPISFRLVSASKKPKTSSQLRPFQLRTKDPSNLLSRTTNLEVWGLELDSPRDRQLISSSQTFRRSSGIIIQGVWSFHSFTTYVQCLYYTETLFLMLKKDFF